MSELLVTFHEILLYLALALAPEAATGFILTDGARTEPVVMYTGQRTDDGAWAVTSGDRQSATARLEGTTVRVTHSGGEEVIDLAQQYQLAGLDLATDDQIMAVGGGGGRSLFMRRNDDGTVTFADAMTADWRVYGHLTYTIAAGP